MYIIIHINNSRYGPAQELLGVKFSDPVELQVYFLPRHIAPILVSQKLMLALLKLLAYAEAAW